MTPGVNGVSEEAEEGTVGIKVAGTEGAAVAMIVFDGAQAVAGTVTVTVDAVRITTVTMPSAPVALTMGVALLPAVLTVGEGAAVMTGAEPAGAMTVGPGATVKRVKDDELLGAAVDGPGTVLKPITMIAGCVEVGAEGASAIVVETGTGLGVSGLSRANSILALAESAGTVIVVVVVVTVTAGASKMVEDALGIFTVKVMISLIEKAPEGGRVVNFGIGVAVAVVQWPVGSEPVIPPVTPTESNTSLAAASVVQSNPVPFFDDCKGRAKQDFGGPHENTCHFSDTQLTKNPLMHACSPSRKHLSKKRRK